MKSEAQYLFMGCQPGEMTLSELVKHQVTRRAIKSSTRAARGRLPISGACNDASNDALDVPFALLASRTGNKIP